MLKKKIENQKRCAEKRKNEDRISLNSNGKKYNIGHNWKSSQSQKLQDKSPYDGSKKSQDKSPYDSMQIASKKCLHKRDVAKKTKKKKTRKGVLKREKIKIEYV